MAVFDLEVDVVRDRLSRPWAIHTHHVTIPVADDISPSRQENLARTLAVGMVASARGEIVTAVRIISAEL